MLMHDPRHIYKQVNMDRYMQDCGKILTTTEKLVML